MAVRPNIRVLNAVVLLKPATKNSRTRILTR